MASEHAAGKRRGSSSSPRASSASRRNEKSELWYTKKKYRRDPSPRRRRFSRRDRSSSRSISRSRTPNRKKPQPPPPPFEIPKPPPPSLPPKNIATTKTHFHRSKFLGDSRPNDALYGKRHPTALVILTLPKNLDNSLKSPLYYFDAGYDAIIKTIGNFVSPLQRFNQHMASPRPDVNNEWWLKGTLSLLVMGIPRTWHVNKILNSLVEAYTRALDPSASPRDNRWNLSRNCKALGIVKFILLFGEQAIAINSLPHNHRVYSAPLKQNSASQVESACNLDPESMGLLVFESEAKALEFWSVLAHVPISAYPYCMRICPDPSGWRIYTEALANYIPVDSQGRLCAQLLATSAPTSNSNTKGENSLDLLSVLTAKSTSPSSATTNTSPNSPAAATERKPQPATYICPFVSHQEHVAEIQQQLAKISAKAMFHEPSRIMSIHFPNIKILQAHAVCTRMFLTPTGAKVHACFIKLPDNKHLPVIRRNNVEHLSNVQVKPKGETKSNKFQPPTVGIVNIDDL